MQWGVGGLGGGDMEREGGGWRVGGALAGWLGIGQGGRGPGYELGCAWMRRGDAGGTAVQLIW